MPKLEITMHLSDYQNEWKNDAKIVSDALDSESLNIPVLHSKYLTYLSNERRLYKKLAITKESKIVTLTDYYSGVIDGRDIGRQPWAIREGSKASVQKRVEGDAEILKIQNVLDEKEEIVLFLKEVIISINQRNFIIKNAIDYMRWSQGN
jgi:hypothetical protein